MTVTINNAQLESINYCVYVRISDILYEEMMKKMPLITVKDEKYNTIFARTTILSSDIDRFKGADIVFSVVKRLESDIYVLRPLAYKQDYKDMCYNETLNAIREYERRNSMFGIKNVIYHDPATIVYWCDCTKTVVKCSENDIYDPEKGLAMAIAKKVFGNEGNYYNQFKKWLPKEDTNTSVNPTDEQIEHIKKSDVITNKNPNDSENTWGF
jgi:hypothetical protein